MAGRDALQEFADMLREDLLPKVGQEVQRFAAGAVVQAHEEFDEASAWITSEAPPLVAAVLADVMGKAVPIDRPAAITGPEDTRTPEKRYPLVRRLLAARRQATRTQTPVRVDAQVQSAEWNFMVQPGKQDHR